MILTQTTSTASAKHPEGIFPAVCVDLIDLGPETTTFEGQTKTQPKLRLTFETQENGEPRWISKKFTASMHPKAKLTTFLSKWRGKDIAPGEQVDLSKLIGASCTLVISHGLTNDGREYAGIDAISKPTKKLTPSGKYDGAAVRAKLTEWAVKDGKTPPPAAQSAPSKSHAAQAAPQSAPVIPNDDDVGF